MIITTIIKITKRNQSFNRIIRKKKINITSSAPVVFLLFDPLLSNPSAAFLKGPKASSRLEI